MIGARLGNRTARPEVEGLSLSLGFPEVDYEELRVRAR